MKEKNDFLADFFLKKRKTLLRGTFWFVLTAVVVLVISIIPERKHDFIAKVYINDIILNSPGNYLIGILIKNYHLLLLNYSSIP